MKIHDVTLTLFAWSNIPPTTYGRHTGRFEGSSELGLLTLRTDEGHEGHAFLGSAQRSATMDAPSLLRFLKPLVLGQDPLDRERLWQAMWQRSRATTLRAIGAMDVALWDLGGKIAGLPIHRLLGSYRDRVPAYASSAVLASKAGEEEISQRLHGEIAIAVKGVEVDLLLNNERVQTLEQQREVVQSRLGRLASARAEYANLVNATRHSGEILKTAQQELSAARAVNAAPPSKIVQSWRWPTESKNQFIELQNLRKSSAWSRRSSV